ncbi:MAG: galactokinase [Clostridia bacterium]|nr:galactokinase [Clostridia bacterium]
MKAEKLKRFILSGGLDGKLAEIYGEGFETQRERYAFAVDGFASRYGSSRDVSLFSVPGRSELSGNHTDHNHGKVIAASVSVDIIAAAAPSDGPVIRVKSKGFPEDTVDISAFAESDPAQFGSSASLIAGCAKGFSDAGLMTGGFDAFTTSDVLSGSGLSSSAAFEDMIGTILSHFYNRGKVGYARVAAVSKFAENAFFGKPCGLMDQMACAAGGIVAIDFGNPAEPVVEKLGFDLTAAGYRLVIIDTGGSHADLTADYASIPAEMKKAASVFDEEVLRDLPEELFVSHIPEIRAAAGDRAVLRGLHFYGENRRVDIQKKALAENDLPLFLEKVKESGNSSFRYLQNVFSPAHPSEQGVALALCLCERLLSGTRRPSAWRVHGGGFAGTVQAFVPEEEVEGFTRWMSAVFGEGSCHLMNIRLAGAVRLI